ncbi:hypothetical protein MPSEU_000142500 [Mayamaea pseudoterrestris]|nr:hypothetical protein MPSEU_000142500 [Mayamaea pseudoterrestris]
MNNTSNSQQSIQSLNWAGSIPIVLSLAPSSLSSPTMPHPIHSLVSRQTYLHIGLESAVMRLHRFAPSILSFASGMVQEEPDIGSSSHHDETDEATSHVNSSLSAASSSVTSSNATSTSTQQQQKYPVCWFEDEETQMALRWHVFVGTLWDQKAPHHSLPWRIKLHFTAYPSSQILPFDTQVLTQVQYYYKNSLKQALCLQHGSQKVAMNVTKESHSKLWDAVGTSNLRLYDSVHAENNALLMLEHLIPVRLYVGSSTVPMQRSCRKSMNDGTVQTLGMLLHDWLPDLFASASDNDQDVAPSEGVLGWRIQGIQPPLNVSVSDLWELLAHPDHFCYIVVLTKESAAHDE